MSLPIFFQRRLLLSAKLKFMSAGVMVAILTITLVVYFTLGDVKKLSVAAASTQTGQLDNARIFTRRLNGVFHEMALFERNFFRNPEQLTRTTAAIRREISALTSTAELVTERGVLEQFVSEFERLLEAGRTINRVSDELSTIDARLQAQVMFMEERLVEGMLDGTTESYEGDYYNQLLALVAGYRESLLNLEKQLAELTNRMLNQNSRDWGEVPINETLDDLKLSVQTMSFETPLIGLVGEEFLNDLRVFKINLDALMQSGRDFHTARFNVLASKKNLQLILEEVEERSSIASQQLKSRLSEIIDRSLHTVLFISALVALLTFIAMRQLVVGAIKQPLRGLIDGIENLRAGRLDQPLALNRSDEWGTIEKALNKMAGELDTSYRNLGAQKKQMAQLAHHDALTGLPNRLLFDDRLAHALKKSQRLGCRVAVLFIDLDRFKHINDSLGHAAGDRLLKTIASRIKACIRQTDTPARQGGDEFVLLLEDIDDVGMLAPIAEKLLAAIAEPVKLDDRQLYTSGSIGIAVSSEEGEDATTLLRNADAAMYEAKQRGRNAYRFYEAQMTAQAGEYLEVESDLRKALLNDELCVYYQPQYRLVNGDIIGAEALVRWQHPTKGLVMPDHFIPIAEQTGLITELDHWVLKQVCRQLLSWHQRWGEAVLPRVSVNVSARQLEQTDMAEAILRITRESGCDPHTLGLELTESFFMKHDEASAAAFAQLRQQGFTLSIDDFGTGYSSLRYLKQLPLHTLKIDRSFVKDVTLDEQDAGIAKSIIALGQHMQLSVIAEGVETQAQADFLIEQGCEYAQGYLFSRPLAVDDFEALLVPELPKIELGGH